MPNLTVKTFSGMWLEQRTHYLNVRESSGILIQCAALGYLHGVIFNYTAGDKLSQWGLSLQDNDHQVAGQWPPEVDTGLPYALHE